MLPLRSSVRAKQLAARRVPWNGGALNESLKVFIDRFLRRESIAFLSNFPVVNLGIPLHLIDESTSERKSLLDAIRRGLLPAHPYAFATKAQEQEDVGIALRRQALGANELVHALRMAAAAERRLAAANQLPYAGGQLTFVIRLPLARSLAADGSVEREGHVNAAIVRLPHGFASLYDDFSVLAIEASKETLAGVLEGKLDKLREYARRTRAPYARLVEHGAAQLLTGRSSTEPGALVTPVSSSSAASSAAAAAADRGSSGDGKEGADAYTARSAARAADAQLKGRHMWMCVPDDVEVWDTVRYPGENHLRGDLRWARQRHGLALTALCMIAQALYPGQSSRAQTLWVDKAAHRTRVPLFDTQWTPHLVQAPSASASARSQEPLPQPADANRHSPADSKDAQGSSGSSSSSSSTSAVGSSVTQSGSGGVSSAGAGGSGGRSLAADEAPRLRAVPGMLPMQRHDRGNGECMMWAVYLPFLRCVLQMSSLHVVHLVDRSMDNSAMQPLVGRFRGWTDRVLQWCREHVEERQLAQRQLSSAAAAGSVPMEDIDDDDESTITASDDDTDMSEVDDLMQDEEKHQRTVGSGAGGVSSSSSSGPRRLDIFEQAEEVFWKWVDQQDIPL